MNSSKWTPHSYNKLSVVILQRNATAPSSMVTRERLTSHDMTCLYASPFPNESMRDSRWHCVLDRDGLEGRELLETSIKWHIKAGGLQEWWSCGELPGACGVVALDDAAYGRLLWASGGNRTEKKNLNMAVGPECWVNDCSVISCEQFV